MEFSPLHRVLEIAQFQYSCKQTVVAFESNFII